jgi:L-malate glycosyltransferase
LRDFVKVVFCQPTLNRTGSENSLLQMVEGLRNRKNNFSLSVLAGEDGVMREDFEQLCKVTVIAAPKLGRSWKVVVQFLASFVTTYRALKPYAQDRNAVVYVNTLMFPQAAIAGLLNGLPVIIHVREVASTYPNAIYRAYLLLAAACAKRVVAACHYVFQQREFPGYLVGKRRRDVLYNAARGNESYISRQVTPPFKILAIIPCTVRKGILDLIDCIKFLKHLLPTDTPFIVDIVGRIAEQETYANILERLRRDQTARHVRFHGESRNIEHFFREAHVLVHPSHSECFPRVLVEACGFSLPCVATDVGGVSEMILDGRNGYLVPVGANEEMAKRLIAIATDANRYAAFSREAHRRFLSAHTVTQLGENCARIIHSSTN